MDAFMRIAWDQISKRSASEATYQNKHKTGARPAMDIQDWVPKSWAIVPYIPATRRPDGSEILRWNWVSRWKFHSLNAGWQRQKPGRLIAFAVGWFFHSPGLAKVGENLESEVAFVSGSGISTNTLDLMKSLQPSLVFPPSLNMLQPPQPSLTLLTMPHSFLPQGLWTCYFLCPEYSSTHTLKDKLLLCRFQLKG